MTLASAERGLRHLFVRDLVLACRIGVGEAERRTPQRVRINLDLAVAEGDGPARCRRPGPRRPPQRPAAPRPRRGPRAPRAADKTLAERLAAVCLEDPRVRAARVRVERLDASPDAASAGVEIERLNPGPAPPPAPPG